MFMFFGDMHNISLKHALDVTIIGIYIKEIDGDMRPTNFIKLLKSNMLLEYHTMPEYMHK